MKKVLLVSTVASTLRAFLLPFAYHFRNKGWQVDAAARGASNCPACSAAFNHVWDIPWARNPLNFNKLYHSAKEIHTLVTQEDYDLVHVHTPVASFVTRFAMRGRESSRRPLIIYTAHGFHFHTGGRIISNGAFKALEKVAGRWTDYLITINKEDYAAAIKYGIVPHKRLKYMPGIGVDRRIYSPDNIAAIDISQLRKGLGVDAVDRLLLVIGELNHNKRPDFILEAFATLPHKGIHLAYAGDGYMESRLRLQAKQLDVHTRTHFLGLRSDIPILLAASDVVILASRREGLPRSIMEALCMEKSCIGSNTRGTRDMLADGCGKIFKTDDLTDLIQTISWVIDHPDQARSMAVQGRKKMEVYDIHRILKLHEDLYAEALASN